MYTKLYISFVVLVMLFTVFKLLFYRVENDYKLCIPKVNFYKVPLFIIIIIIFITFFPAGYGSDKGRYLDLFLNIEKKVFNKDIGWVYYNKIIKFFFNDANIFFLLTAALYLYANYAFIKNSVNKSYVFYFLITTIGSLGFYAYGVNTIRAGIGLSFILLAIINRKNWCFFLFVSLAIIIHKSMIITALAFFITKYYSNSRRLLAIWITFLIASIINITALSEFIKNTFADGDERVKDYMASEVSSSYNTSFRIDFLLYSILPLLVGFYYIYNKNFKDIFYIRLFNMYIIVNSFWLLLIRVPFTDRFAYLSWFLIPFIALYPLFNMQNIYKRNKRLAITISVIIILNFILIFR